MSQKQLSKKIGTLLLTHVHWLENESNKKLITGKNGMKYKKKIDDLSSLATKVAKQIYVIEVATFVS